MEEVNFFGCGVDLGIGVPTGSRENGRRETGGGGSFPAWGLRVPSSFQPPSFLSALSHEPDLDLWEQGHGHGHEHGHEGCKSLTMFFKCRCQILCTVMCRV